MSATAEERITALVIRGTPSFVSFSASIPRIMPTTMASVSGIRTSDIM